MINLSDDSEQEGGDDDFEAGRPRSFTAFPSSPFGSSPNEFLVPGKGHAVSVSSNDGVVGEREEGSGRHWRI